MKRKTEMKTFRRTMTVTLTLLLSLAVVPLAFAHPLGNFSINQHVSLTVSREMIEMDYILDMAEIPAFQEIATFDSNGNGRADPFEFSAYHADKCASLQPHLNLLAGRKALPLTLASSSVEFPAGVGGLPTLRLTCQFQAALDPAVNALELSFVNNAFPDRPGWREIVVHASGVALQGDYSTTSLSNRLTDYPQDLLNSPLDERQVGFVMKLDPASARSDFAANALANPSLPADRNDPFTRLILLEELTPATTLLALVVSFIWGAMHAMTPGHGKTIVGAYLVGSRGTVRHAFYLGLTTTITHTLGVFALGFVTLFAAQYVLPERLYPWMSLLSGLFVVGIGLNLFAGRLKSAGLQNWLASFKDKFARSQKFALRRAIAGDGGWSMNKSHLQGVTHPHKYVLYASHNHPHSHDHGHYRYDHAGHSHDHHGHHRHDREHDHHDHAHGHEGHHHHDGDGSHSHTPPETVTWRSLLALGVSGGLIPCPSALVVLLGAIALNKIGFGLILVLAFSLGLAGALTAIGVLFIYAGKLLERFPTSGKFIGVLPAFSALFISLIGLGIVVKAAVEIGVG
jgi:nickel/cobalt exporter